MREYFTSLITDPWFYLSFSFGLIFGITVLVKLSKKNNQNL